MPRRTPALAILGALLTMLALAPAAAQGARSVPVGFYGINYSGNYELASAATQTKLWNKLAAGGAESARVLFNWDLAEHSPGVYNWGRIDALVYNATKRGMDILPTVEYAPVWAKQFKGQVASPPAGTANYTRFLRQLILRYGPNGTFWAGSLPLSHRTDIPYKPIHQWAVWNEPEIGFHWFRGKHPWGPADAQQYAKLLADSYSAVHSTDPTAKVVMAALSINSWKNLQHFYDWTNIKGHFDVAALQGYAGTAAYLPTLMSNFRATLNRNGASSLPMYVDEMTWPAAKGKAHPRYTTGYMTGFLTNQNGAANRLTKGYSLLRQGRTRWNLQRVFWYTAASRYTGTFEYDYSGLLTIAGSGLVAHPVYTAYQRSAQAAEGCAKGPNGACR